MNVPIAREWSIPNVFWDYRVFLRLPGILFVNDSESPNLLKGIVVDKRKKRDAKIKEHKM